MAIGDVWQWAFIAFAVGEHYDVDWRVVLSVICLESGGRADAVSEAGAVGLMQVMPKEAGPAFVDRPPMEELKDPLVNVVYGTRLLKRLLKYYGGDLKQALCAYYMGIGGLANKGLESEPAKKYLNAFRKAWGQLFPGKPCPV
jgi:soluble lytic murein transglycosylase-like protein